MDNGVCEAFNGSPRRECLTRDWFASLVEARVVLTSWRDDYNNHRPHTPWRFDHRRLSEALVTTRLGLELCQSDALDWTYFGDPGQASRRQL